MELWWKYSYVDRYIYRMEGPHPFTKSRTRVQYYFSKRRTKHNKSQLSLILQKLVRGVYQYKYIVDGDWRFSPDDATTHDEQGNINNVIDTTTIEPAIQEISRQDSGVIPEKKYQKVEINTQTQFHDNAPQVPAHLLQITFLNVLQIQLKVVPYGKSFCAIRKRILELSK